MAMVKLFRDRKNRDTIILCPFIRHPRVGGGANMASGDLVRLTIDEFRQNGHRYVTELLAAFGSGDASVKSELYNRMTSAQRNRFLSQHDMMNISVDEGKHTARLYIGEGLDFCGTVPFPFEEETFADQILAALDSLNA